MENGQPVEKALTLKRPVVKYVNESRSLLPTLWQWIPFVAVCIALTTLVGLAAISLRQYASDQYHRREDPQAKRTEKQIGVVLKLVAPYLAGIVTMFPMTGSDVALKREIATLKEILNKPPEAAQQIGKDNYGPIPPGPKAALPDDPPVPQ
jgi:hypothetical protein